MLLYYSIADYPTMLVALGSLATHQTQATKNMYICALRLLDYAASHPEATIRYVATGCKAA